MSGLVIQLNYGNSSNETKKEGKYFSYSEENVIIQSVPNIQQKEGVIKINNQEKVIVNKYIKQITTKHLITIDSKCKDVLINGGREAIDVLQELRDIYCQDFDSRNAYITDHLEGKLFNVYSGKRG